MVHLLLKEIRGAMNFSCASSSSVAIKRHDQRRQRNSKSSSSNSERHQEHNPKSFFFPREEELPDATLATSPTDSSRYLLDIRRFLPSDDSSFFLERIPPGTGSEFSRSRCTGGDRASPPRTKDQVVVLRVSLHCKGCEGKVRRRISKMEGVRSFSVDLASKKVTVMGDVSPLEVLSSITKVKKAYLIHPPPPPPPLEGL